MSAPGRARSRHWLRVRLTVASFLLSALVVTGALAALIGFLHHDVGVSVEARLRDRTAALAATVDTSSGTVDITGADDALLDTPNWVFDASGLRVEGAAPRRGIRSAVERLGAATSTTEARSGALHLRAMPVRENGRILAVVVTGVDDTPYITTLTSTTRGAVVLGALAVLGATGLAALVLAQSLGPIAAMTDRAAEWSRVHSARRFALGPPRDELTGLAAVLDDLLDRVDDALSAERRLTAEIAHELRTPVTLLAGEADLALMSRTTAPSELARYERIRDASSAMARAVTTLLDAAAEGWDADTDVAEAVATAVSTLGRSAALRLDGPPTHVPIRFGHLERMLAPVLDNATAVASAIVDVRLRRAGNSVVIAITDDGPGVADSVRDHLFVPGITTKTGGTGLGLALARRLAREAGGDLELVSARPATFELRLPASRPTSTSLHAVRVPALR